MLNASATAALADRLAFTPPNQSELFVQRAAYNGCI